MPLSRLELAMAVALGFDVLATFYGIFIRYGSSVGLAMEGHPILGVFLRDHLFLFFFAVVFWLAFVILLYRIFRTPIIPMMVIVPHLLGGMTWLIPSEPFALLSMLWLGTWWLQYPMFLAIGFILGFVFREPLAKIEG